MRLFITAIRQGSFKNDQNETVEYSKAQVMNDSHEDNARVKGRRCDEYRVPYGIIETVDAKTLPGWFDCEVQLNNGKVDILSFKPVQNAPAPGASSVSAQK